MKIQSAYINNGYTYEIMELELLELKAKYPFLEIGIAGKSVLGKALYYIKLGEGPNQVLYNASHHATEWITTPVLMKFTKNFLHNYVNGKPLRGYDLEKLRNKSTIYIIPMVNPDGVDLVINGLHKDNPYYKDLSRFIDEGFDSWKSNIKGVDLNRNYNAKWEDYVKLSKKLGLNQPGPRGYAGPFPESEPESKAVADFTRLYDLRLVLAYHAQGEVIYWKFDDLEPPESLPIGEAFAKASGYELSDVYESAALAGYKDWFIQDYKKPGYTIEVGIGQNPLPISQFPKIYEDNEELLLLAAII